MPKRWLAYKTFGSVLSVLSHPARLRIVDELSGGERDVNALREALSITQSAASQHLALMRSHNLVMERREGRHVIYWLTHPGIGEWLRHGVEMLNEPIEAQWAPWGPQKSDSAEIFLSKKKRPARGTRGG